MLHKATLQATTLQNGVIRFGEKLQNAHGLTSNDYNMQKKDTT